MPLRRINRIIYQEVIPPGILAFVVLTFVVFSREFGRLTELLIKKNADGLTILQVVVYLLPSILVFTVPIAFLVGALIGFSRLSSESEIVAMRAGGVSLLQILTPVVKLGAGVSLLTLFLTLFVLPQGNWRLKLLREEIGVRPVRSQIKPRVFNEDFPGTLLYVHDVQVGSEVWSGVMLAHGKQEGRRQLILSRTGQIAVDPDGRQVQVFLEDGANYEFNENEPGKYSVSSFGSLGVAVDLPQTEPVDRRPRKPAEKSLQELLRDSSQAPGEVEFQSRVEIHRRIALAFAPVGLCRSRRHSGNSSSSGRAGLPVHHQPGRRFHILYVVRDRHPHGEPGGHPLDRRCLGGQPPARAGSCGQLSFCLPGVG